MSSLVACIPTGIRFRLSGARPGNSFNDSSTTNSLMFGFTNLASVRIIPSAFYEHDWNPYLPYLSLTGKDRQQEIWQTGEMVKGLLNNLASRRERKAIGRDIFN